MTGTLPPPCAQFVGPHAFLVIGDIHVSVPCAATGKWRRYDNTEESSMCLFSREKDNFDVLDNSDGDAHFIIVVYAQR